MVKTRKWFKHPPNVASLFFLCVIFLVTAEISLRIFGFGDPVIYEKNDACGYRLIPNQKVKRFNGSTITINNLSLRTEKNWDENKQNKILFLGDSITYGGSYVDDKDLFSSLVLKEVQGDFESGNAGTNGWGVENIHGLVVGLNFLPTRIYITILVEEDFYRGFTKIDDAPFWTKKPRFAIEEVIRHYAYVFSFNHKRDWIKSRKDEEAVRKSVIKLKEMDRFLKRKGHRHKIYITPGRKQLFEGAGIDKIVHDELKKNNVSVIYLLDRLKQMDLSAVKNKIFRDEYHLNKEGHHLWAELIGDDLKLLIK